MVTVVLVVLEVKVMVFVVNNVGNCRGLDVAGAGSSCS